MKRNHIISTKFSKEEIELIDRAVVQHDKLIKTGKTSRSLLIRVGTIELCKGIIATGKVTMKFEEE